MLTSTARSAQPDGSQAKPPSSQTSTTRSNTSRNKTSSKRYHESQKFLVSRVSSQNYHSQFTSSIFNGAIG